MTDTEKLLAERATTHGEYSEHARITQGIMDLIQGGRNWPRLAPIQRESLHMFAHKIGRICEGDPNHRDHWDDISGYAVLVSQRLMKPDLAINGGTGASTASEALEALSKPVPVVGPSVASTPAKEAFAALNKPVPVHAVGDKDRVPMSGGAFTDANGERVVSGDYVEYGIGSGLNTQIKGRGIVSDILQDGDATFTYDFGLVETVKWKNLCKVPRSLDARPVPVEDSNRHADRAELGRLPAGVNSYEFMQLPKEDRNLYRWNEERQEYRLRGK